LLALSGLTPQTEDSSAPVCITVSKLSLQQVRVHLQPTINIHHLAAPMLLNHSQNTRKSRRN
jgi:hypothetical protein